MVSYKGEKLMKTIKEKNDWWTGVTEKFNNPNFTEEQLDFLFKKFPACMGHLTWVIMKNNTDKTYRWQDFYENDLPHKRD